MSHPRSRGSCWRSKSKPFGNTSSKAVRDGTVLARRALVLLLVAAAKGCWWVSEQPSTSSVEYLPCFQHLLKMMSVRRLNVAMADYGAPTEKRTALYSSNLGTVSTFLLWFNSLFLKRLCVSVNRCHKTRYTIRVPRGQKDSFGALFLVRFVASLGKIM